ncbi:MAG: hypothetical protein MJZ16_13320, partial [Bacteroidales bacterium]|nr:hypothetical protein [Bacteroidales bacterium]
MNVDESRSILVKADPSVNAWLNAQIGSMDCIFFYVDYCNKNGERNFFRATLQEIGIKPVEYLQMTKNSNIREIILELMWRQARSKYDGTVRILTGDPEELKVGEILPENNYLLAMSLYEFDLVAESLSGILSRSRELRASDIFPNYLNDSNEEDFMDIEELKSRYCSVFTQMTGLLGDMKTVANSLEGKPYATDKQLVVMYKLMTHCACAGMYNEVIPFDSSLFVSDLDLVYQRHMFDKGLEKQKKFFEQFVSATLVLEDKISKAKEIADPDSDKAYASSEYIDAVRELTLKDLRVICHFDLNKYSGENMSPFMYGPYAALAENYLNSGNFKEDALNEWIGEISEVRPGMHLLQQLRMLNSCRGSLLPRTGVGIYQTLAGDGANKKYSSEWLGWKVSSEAVLNDADSLILFNNENFNRMRCNSGLVMDSWLEYIPYRKQTAGMVFRCDVPDAESPQALLLAVHPECGLAKQSKWTGSHIFNILQSAKELMQIRTVDPDLIA